MAIHGSVISWDGKTGQGIIRPNRQYVQAPNAVPVHVGEVEKAGALFLVPGQEVEFTIGRAGNEICAVGLVIE